MRQHLVPHGSLYSGDKDDALSMIEHGDKTFHLIWNLADELDFLYPDQQELTDYPLLARIPDFGIPPQDSSFPRQVSQVIRILERGMKVFVHCMGGHGRTGIAIACIKKRMGLTSEEALLYSSLHCDGPETEEQKDYVRNFL